jgi:hypothetical protein
LPKICPKLETPWVGRMFVLMAVYGLVHRTCTLRRVCWVRVGSHWHANRRRSNRDSDAPGASMGRSKVSTCRKSVPGWRPLVLDECLSRCCWRSTAFNLKLHWHRTCTLCGVCWVESYAYRGSSTAAGAFTARLVNVKGDENFSACILQS